MQVDMTVNSSLYEELITSNYEAAKLMEQLHRETAVLINKRYWSDEDDKPVTVYHVSWRKGR